MNLEIDSSIESYHIQFLELKLKISEKGGPHDGPFSLSHSHGVDGEGAEESYRSSSPTCRTTGNVEVTMWIYKEHWNGPVFLL